MGAIGGDLVSLWGAVFTSGMFLWAGSRALAIVSYALLSAAVATGSAQSARLLRGRAVYFLHRALALWGLAAAVGHALLLLGDREFRFGPAALLVPGASPYRPAGVALGVAGVYLLAAAALPFLVPARRLPRGLRVGVHRVAYLAWVLASIHALAVGSDVEGALFRSSFLASVGVGAFGLFYRLLGREGRAGGVLVRARGREGARVLGEGGASGPGRLGAPDQ